jgi:hypothetical protein
MAIDGLTHKSPKPPGLDSAFSTPDRDFTHMFELESRSQLGCAL